MIIETQRLQVRLLNSQELVNYANGKNPFDDVSINFAKEEIDEPLYPVLFNTIIPNVTIRKKDPVFSSLWLVIEKRFNSSIGSILFKGDPDKNKTVEIGYGTHEEFQNRGYMTEAVGALCDWVLSSGKAKSIIAETAKDNAASFGVLEKNGFVKYKENEEFYYWKRQIEINNM